MVMMYLCTLADLQLVSRVLSVLSTETKLSKPNIHAYELAPRGLTASTRRWYVAALIT
jgi:hypothetical protein